MPMVLSGPVTQAVCKNWEIYSAYIPIEFLFPFESKFIQDMTRQSALEYSYNFQTDVLEIYSSPFRLIYLLPMLHKKNRVSGFIDEIVEFCYRNSSKLNAQKIVNHTAS